MSLVTPEGMRAVEVNEDVFQYQILQVEVQRQKDGPLQRTAVCPHRDGVLEDCCFSLMCLLVVVGCDNEFVSPTFSKAALKTKLGKSDSEVSSLWRTFSQFPVSPVRTILQCVKETPRCVCP